MISTATYNSIIILVFIITMILLAYCVTKETRSSLRELQRAKEQAAAHARKQKIY